MLLQPDVHHQHCPLHSPVNKAGEKFQSFSRYMLVQSAKQEFMVAFLIYGSDVGTNRFKSAVNISLCNKRGLCYGVPVHATSQIRIMTTINKTDIRKLV